MAKRRGRKKKGPDTDLLALAVGAFVFAAAVFYYYGSGAVMFYGIPITIGVALLYQAYA